MQGDSDLFGGGAESEVGTTRYGGRSAVHLYIVPYVPHP